MSSSLTCPGCVARERQLTDLKQVLQHLQKEVRKQLGHKSSAVLDALDGQAPLTPAEVGKRAKTSELLAHGILKKLLQRGLVRRSGWRDVPGARWPRPEYQLVGARETLNGATPKA